MNQKRTESSFMTRQLVCFLAISVAVCSLPEQCAAQLIEEEPSYQNNLDPLSEGSETANITNTEMEEVSGTAEGRITLKRTDGGIEVYSGRNRVEWIPQHSEGWVGSIREDGGALLFHPTGRPELLCPHQGESSGWYGPCEIADF